MSESGETRVGDVPARPLPLCGKRARASLLDLVAFVALLAAVGACSGEPPAAAPPRERAAAPARPPSDASAWLLSAPTDDERFERLAKHLRGFDVAMVEVGYRYGELYWAGHDRNWEYAEYQLGKIETAVANGIERRPARADSARMLAGAIEPVRVTVRARDPAAFDTAFGRLTVTCHACHQAERVPFIHPLPPRVRASVAAPPPPAP